MAYTNVWSSASPLGSQAANTADDEFRKFRVDIEDRMEDKFITDIVTDPWVVKPEILGNLNGKELLVHHTAFQIFASDGSSIGSIRTIANNDRVQIGTTSSIGWAPVRLPVGITITKIELLANANSLGTITMTLNREAFNAIPTITLVGSCTVSGSGNTIGASGVLSFVTLTSEMLFLELSGLVGNMTIHGARITYNTPDCRRTL